LSGFEGTMLFVSHDRTFLRGMANRVLDLSGSLPGGAKGPQPFLGTYEEWVERTGQEAPGVWR
jgi:ATPase subunit of ABC transporter with duplicated ATPase domains